MAIQEHFSSNKATLFNGKNYAFWSIRIQTHIMALGFDVWKSIVTSYKDPTIPPINQDGKKACKHNAKAMNYILSSISESRFIKVMPCELEKCICD